MDCVCAAWLHPIYGRFSWKDGVCAAWLHPIYGRFSWKDGVCAAWLQSNRWHLHRLAASYDGWLATGVGIGLVKAMLGLAWCFEGCDMIVLTDAADL